MLTEEQYEEIVMDEADKCVACHRNLSMPDYEWREDVTQFARSLAERLRANGVPPYK